MVCELTGGGSAGKEEPEKTREARKLAARAQPAPRRRPPAARTVLVPRALVAYSSWTEAVNPQTVLQLLLEPGDSVRILSGPGSNWTAQSEAVQSRARSPPKKLLYTYGLYERRSSQRTVQSSLCSIEGFVVRFSPQRETALAPSPLLRVGPRTQIPRARSYVLRPPA